MGLYSDVIFPRFYDRAVDRPELRAHRERQLAGLSGTVLEVGVGTGLNLPHYPESVERIVTVEPNPGMGKQLRKRIAACPIPVEQHRISGESLPFDAGRFDFVVSTLTLCSIPNVAGAVEEFRRVLCDSGRFVFFEHGLHSDPKVARWQRRLNWLQKLYADGCQLTLDVRELMESSGFRTVELDTFELEGAPRIHGYTYRGAATK